MSSYVQRVKPGLLNWLESIRFKEEGWGRWPYHAKMVRPWALQASAIGVRILNELAELGKATEAQRAEAVAFFQGCQDPADGLFKDPLETEAYHTGNHTWEQVWGQRNGAAIEALRLLGGAPRHPLARSQFGDLTRVDPTRWTLEQIDWRNPWGHGESWSRAIRAYLDHRTSDADLHDDPTLNATFEAVERHIFAPETGTPNRRMPEPNPSVAMAGLFKVMSAYLAVGRPIPHARAGIDSTLALQNPDGEFGFRRNMCINWDALWVLRHLDIQLDGGHRHDEIVGAGRRCADVLMRDYLKPDGGFAFHGEHCQTTHHSIMLSPEKYPIGDMLGSTMCLKCLTYADEWLSGSTLGIDSELNQPAPQPLHSDSNS